MLQFDGTRTEKWADEKQADFVKQKEDTEKKEEEAKVSYKKLLKR